MHLKIECSIKMIYEYLKILFFYYHYKYVVNDILKYINKIYICIFVF